MCEFYLYSFVTSKHYFEQSSGGLTQESTKGNGGEFSSVKGLSPAALAWPMLLYLPFLLLKLVQHLPH